MPRVQPSAALLALAALLVLPSAAVAAPTDLDASFGTNGVTTTPLFQSSLQLPAFAGDVAAQADGKLVVVGSRERSGPTYDWTVTRYSADGALDTGFGTSGTTVLVESGSGIGGTAVALDAAGGIFFSGQHTGGSNAPVIVYKRDSTGAPAAFSASIPISQSTRTTAQALAVQPDGKVVVAGNAFIAGHERVFVARFDTNGSADTGFDGDGGTADGLVVLPDTSCDDVGAASDCTAGGLALSTSSSLVNAIYVGGTNMGNLVGGRVWRLVLSGGAFVLDTSYGAVTTPGGAQIDRTAVNGVEDLLLQADGKVVVAGFAQSGPSYQCGIARLQITGQPDTGFGTAGAGRINLGGTCAVNDLAADTGGRFVVAGLTTEGTFYSGTSSLALGRFTGAGQPDPAFASGGAAAVVTGGTPSYAQGLLLQGAKPVVAGLAKSPHELMVARFTGGDLGAGSGSGSGSGTSTDASTGTPASTPAPVVVPADTVAPKISIDYPADRSRTTDNRPLASGTASDDPGDATAVAVELRRALGGGKYGAVRMLRGRRTGRFWTARLPRLRDGQWFMRAYLSDAAGNRGNSEGDLFTVGKLGVPKNAGRFTVDGQLDVGEVLGVRGTADWKPADDLSLRYRWYRCADDPRPSDCDPATDQSQSSLYRVQKADRGRRLRVAIYASNPDRTAPTEYSELTSRAVPVPDQIPFIANQRFPRVLGSDISVDDVVSAEEGDWRASPSSIRYAYRWQVCRFVVWCEDVGTAKTYRVRPADEGHRLNVIVTASNRAGSNYAWSGQGAPIAGDRAARRRAAVSDAYNRAFGRDPKPAETAYWASRSEDTAAMVRNHQQFIRDNRSVAEEVVRAAYEKVYGHGPYTSTTAALADQTAQFNADVAAEQASGTTYDDLVTQYATALAGQAIDRIFWWASDVSNTALVDAHIRNRDVSTFVDRVRRDVYVNGGSTRGENLWTDVAVSNEPLHGAGRTSYPGAGSKGAADRENCYGAVGPGCTGVPGGMSDSSVAEPFTTLDGRRMSYLKVTTAVGSITHDAMCRVYPWTSYLKFDNGGWCGDAAFDPTEFLPVAKIWVTGAAEWNKATANTIQGRKWFEFYGPYPAPDSTFARKDKHARTYSDDLRTAARQYRYTELTRGGLFLGIADLDKPFKWQGTEIRGSLRLEAPQGTNLDASDKDFCQAKRFAFKTPGTVPGQRNYNTCA